MLFMKPKKKSHVSGNRLGENFFYHSPACIVKCVSEYIFNSKTNNTKKAKETKEEQRISPENR